MEPISFRIFDPELKKFHYSGSTPSMLSGYFKQTATLVTVHNMEHQQYTGRHDKNGAEIYQGDIGKDAYGRIFSIVFVDYRADCYGLMMRYSDGSYCHLEHLNNIEVIGNIHDNPELLTSVY